MEISFNASEYQKEQSNRVLPEGKYKVKITDVEKAISRNTGKNMWVFSTEIQDKNFKGYQHKYWLVLDSQYINSKIGDLIMSCAITPMPTKVTENLFKGKIAYIKTKNEVGDDGETRSRLARFVAPPKQDNLFEVPEDRTPVVSEDDIPF